MLLGEGEREGARTLGGRRFGEGDREEECALGRRRFGEGEREGECARGGRRFGEGVREGECALGGRRFGEGLSLGGVGGGFPVYAGVVGEGVYIGGGSKDALTRSASVPVGAPTSIAACRSLA